MGNNISDSSLFQSPVEPPYKGDVRPADAWKELESDKDAILVDVRTAPEWGFVGVPNLSSIGKQATLVSWRVYPSMDVNENFVSQFENGTKANKETKIFCICKIGGRSADAAAELTKNGYANCYNIEGGFEGDIDKDGHRANINGWKATKLPWEQR